MKGFFEGFKLKFGISFTLSIGVLACFFDDALVSSMNSTLASIAAAFPEVPYTTILMLVSAPPLCVIPAALISGWLCGRVLPFKAVLLAGFTIVMVAGVLPYFLNSFEAILASRLLFGVGVGLQTPQGPALTMIYYDDDSNRATMLGIGNGVLNAVGVITVLLTGFLCTISWRHSFLTYLVTAVPILLISLFLKEPSHVQAKAREAAEKTRERLPLKVVALCLFFTVSFSTLAIAGMQVSAIVADKGLGTPAEVGIIMSCLTAGGIVFAILYGTVYKIAKGYTVVLGLAINGIGLALIAFVPNLWVMALGLFLDGGGLNFLLAGLENEIGRVCPKSRASFASGLFLACENVGLFACSLIIGFIMNVLGMTSPEQPVTIACGFMFVYAVAFAIWKAAELRQNPGMQP